MVYNAVRAVFTLFCLWTSFLAFNSKNKEDWLIGFLALGVVSINLSFVLLSFTGVDMTSYTTTWGSFLISASAVIYVALRYAHTNTSLEHQLVEVKKLSEQNLLREGEKQQLLSSQKETLEHQVTIRTAELNHQKKELQKTLEDLKSTQTLLIQSEKMASLGELTAGIAHEIQNPLNFVNNFSEVNGELISELVDEVDKGNTEEVKAIANDIKDNSEKINHHGKRADAIVKGMLEHSKTSTGKKDLTDINKLVDEYLRLAYHGLRAKDKSFNAEIKTDFDESIDKLNVVPQDIGRVLLNLFNNAFYTAMQKQKDLTGSSNLSGQQHYVPTVTIVTKKAGDKVEIRVKDNGSGIPQNIVDKIFQPFFTTKPTGQGTGLGLSLAYDIVKAHGGEIMVESKEGEGSEFVIQLPA